jgi:L-Ala-D/L-Glu epimerase
MTFSDGRVSQGIAVPVEEVTGESREACLAAISGPLRDCLLSRNLSEQSIADILDDAQPGSPAAKSGVEMAWRAAFNQSQDRFSVTTDATVSLASTRAACEQAEYWVESGFTHLKVKADSRPTISTHIKSIAAAVPGAKLRIDPNQSWTLKQARLIAEELANANVCVDFIEQPLPVHRDEDLAELCIGAPFPIAADESARSAEQLPPLVRAGVSVAIVKIGKVGGWQRALEMAREADQLGMSVIVSTMLEPLPCVVEAARLARQVAPEKTHDLDAALFFIDGPDSYVPPRLVI